MLILGSYIAGSVETGVWRQASSTAPVPDAFTWAHYLAMSQGLIAHNRTREGFTLLSICFGQYKSHLMNPDPFFWLATYKAALLLAHRDTRLGEIFIKYASNLTAIMLPRDHPFNLVWSRINITGLPGLQKHAAALFESYLNSCRGEVGLLPTDQASLVQMGFVFIQLQCSGMVPYSFTREALGGMLRLLSRSVSSQFLLNEAKFRMACLFLEQRKLDDADDVISQILTWIDSLQYPDRKEHNHLRCKCLWTMFEIEDRRGNVEEASRIGHSLIDLCLNIYGPVHLQTIDAISAVGSFHTRNNNVDAARKLAEEFDLYWESFSNVAEEKHGFPHTIEQPWLHRCIELEEDQKRIQQVVDLLQQNLWLEDP
jgi:hypothetical protein